MTQNREGQLKASSLQNTGTGLTQSHPEELQTNMDCLVCTRTSYHKHLEAQGANTEIPEAHAKRERNDIPETHNTNMEKITPDTGDDLNDTNNESEDEINDDVDHIDIDHIDITGWQKSNGLWQVPPEHRTSILCYGVG